MANSHFLTGEEIQVTEAIDSEYSMCQWLRYYKKINVKISSCCLRVDPGCLTPNVRMQLQRVRERARGMSDEQNS